MTVKKYPVQSQFLFPDRVYLVHSKAEDGGQETAAFSDGTDAIATARTIWAASVAYIVEDLDEDEIDELWAESCLNEDAGWVEQKIPCHAWCAETCWDEVWVEEQPINHHKLDYTIR
jgi:hypothetical protein